MSHNVNPLLSNHAGKPGKEHFAENLEAAGGSPGYPLARLKHYNLRVGANYPVDARRLGPFIREDVDCLGHSRNLEGAHHESTDRTGNCVEPAAGVAAWGCNGDQIESGVKTTGAKLEKAGGAIESGTKSLGEKIKESGAGSKLEGAAI